MSKSRILFLCTGNSARSIIAEAIANGQFGDHLEAFSAGSDPKPEPHPMALQTLADNKVSAEGLRSKNWAELRDQPFDLVITLCDSARHDPCPVFPGEPPHVHWSLPDPPAADHPKMAFMGVFDALEEAIGLLVNAPDPALLGRAREATRQIARRFAPKAF